MVVGVGFTRVRRIHADTKLNFTDLDTNPSPDPYPRHTESHRGKGLRAVASRKCTFAEIIGASGHILICPTTRAAHSVNTRTCRDTTNLAGSDITFLTSMFQS